MAPNSDKPTTDDKRQISFPDLKYPVTRDYQPTGWNWLEGKRRHDGAENLWRIHDSLYDLTDFIKLHPGGPQWLTITKGTDITEAFEIHHLKGIAQEKLPKYFVKKTDTPRNSPFTFKEDGFYKTLKAKVTEKIKEIPKDVRRRSDYITDGLLAAFVVLTSLSCWMMNKNILIGLALIPASSYILSCIAACSHNYFHRKDNWRMYLFNLIGLNYSEWRVSHALSHHIHTNTAQDLELRLFEPFLIYMPYQEKSVVEQLGIMYWPIIYVLSTLKLFVMEFAYIVTRQDGIHLNWTHSIPLLMLSWMWIFGGLPLHWTALIWLATIMIASFVFITYGITAGHHRHDNFFEGDKPRAEYRDWGLHQLDVIVDRVENLGFFTSLTQFGHHYLHHFFPTLDDAELTYLYPILYEHCTKYGVKMRTTTFHEAFTSQFKQILRTTPHDFKAIQR